MGIAEIFISFSPKSLSSTLSAPQKITFATKGYFDEESDVLEEELWEGMGSDRGEGEEDEEEEEEDEEEGEREGRGGHHDSRQPTPQDFEEWDDEEGHHDPHDRHDEHGNLEEEEEEEEEEEGHHLDHDLEHHMDHDLEHGHYEHEEEGDFEQEPELKETYNPYEMPEGHNYFLPPEGALLSLSLFPSLSLSLPSASVAPLSLSSSHTTATDAPPPPHTRFVLSFLPRPQPFSPFPTQTVPRESFSPTSS